MANKITILKSGHPRVKAAPAKERAPFIKNNFDERLPAQDPSIAEAIILWPTNSDDVINHLRVS